MAFDPPGQGKAQKMFCPAPAGIMNGDIQVTIGVPSNRGIRPKTVQCLLKLVANGGYVFDIVVAEHGYTIAENRNYIATKALNNGSQFLLFIDDDMTFEPDLLDKLMANGRDKKIIGVAYRPRCETGNKLAFLDRPTVPLDETHIITLENSTDPKYKDTFKCKAVGTGIMLIYRQVLIDLARPWFAFEYFETGQCKMGEDWYFCFRAREAGYQIYCDPKIPVGHIGEKIY